MDGKGVVSVLDRKNVCVSVLETERAYSTNRIEIIPLGCKEGS